MFRKHLSKVQKNPQNTAKKAQKITETKYFLYRFAELLAPTLTTMAPRRSRRALSIELVCFQNGPSLVPQKCRIPPPMAPKPSIEDTDSVSKWFQACQWWFQARIPRVLSIVLVDVQNGPFVRHKM